MSRATPLVHAGVSQYLQSSHSEFRAAVIPLPSRKSGGSVSGTEWNRLSAPVVRSAVPDQEFSTLFQENKGSGTGNRAYLPNWGVGECGWFHSTRSFRVVGTIASSAKDQ